MAINKRIGRYYYPSNGLRAANIGAQTKNETKRNETNPKETIRDCKQQNVTLHKHASCDRLLENLD